MSFDANLARRIRALLTDEKDVTEKRMFGGLAFMVAGNMCCGVSGDRLMARVGLDKYENWLSMPHAAVMDFTGKPLKGYVYVEKAGLEKEADLAEWVRVCLDFNKKLPPKPTSTRP